MPRTIRIEYAGAVYHVMCRGDRHEAIFRDKVDHVCFLDTLAETCERTGFRIHAYVLMGNHYHLLLETPEPNLVAGMKWFQGTYTQRFNRRHRVGGHLFQGRYKAIPVQADDDGYFMTVSTYIHLNPARAGLLTAVKGRLADYPWSSFPRFVRESKLPEWLVRDRVFASHDLPDEGSGSRSAMGRCWSAGRSKCAAGRSPKNWPKSGKAIRRGWYVGDDAFRDRLLELADRRASGRRRASYRGGGLRCMTSGRQSDCWSRRHRGSGWKSVSCGAEDRRTR
jgi:Transposase and inactivated derivatives